MPEHDVDHRNGIRDDNRWDNLRHVTRLCNMQNQKKRMTNSSGYPGVCWYKRSGRWSASATIGGKVVYLGRYRSVIDAALARYTFEIQCSKWTCNHRSELTKAIKKAFPKFKGVE